MKSVFLFFICSFAWAAVEPKIIYEQDSSLLNTTLQIIVTAGAADDRLEHAGLANMTAELMLRGTKKRTRDKFQSEVERMGAALSGAASHEMMHFTGAVIKENTRKFLDLIEDFLLQPALDTKELEFLRTETLAEISNQKNSNTRLTGIALRREVFAGTPLERPVIGCLSAVRSIKREDVLRKYNNHIHRGNVFFAVSSALPEGEIKKRLTAIWLKLPDGLRQTRKIIPPKIPAVPTITLIHKPKTQAGAFMLGQAGMTILDPDRYTLQVGNFSFGGEPLVSRLFRIVRGELGYTYSIGSTYGLTGSLSGQKGVFAIHSTPSIEFTTKAMLKTLALWGDYQRDGLTPAEMQLATRSIVNSYPFEFDSANKRLVQRIQEYLYNDPILSPEEFGKKINGIGSEVLKKAVHEHHTPKAFVITLLADEAVIKKQFEDEQSAVPVDHRLKITKVMTPEQLVE
ncbi:MAG: insulinase family protein [Deltaproteobacteria bacterium]|nr:insulinase family protein [Deltaproteobacteria bacterium]MBI3295138.1 insulinase family protein [Deltaproteobacteria bacterium]